jgi:hypothetical protein
MRVLVLVILLAGCASSEPRRLMRDGTWRADPLVVRVEALPWAQSCEFYEVQAEVEVAREGGQAEPLRLPAGSVIYVCGVTDEP